MRVVLVLANQPQEACELKAKELIPSDVNFDLVSVFQSELRMKEEIERDNHAFVACIIDGNKSISDATIRVLRSKNGSGCKIIEDVSFF